MKQQERPINYWEFSDEEKLSLFEEIKENPDISFEKVARQLYSVDQKHEFSFISKMLHTINTSRPIYDSQVNASRKYIAEEVAPELSATLRVLGANDCEVAYKTRRDSDADPTVLLVPYYSILPEDPYIKAVVKVEFSCRSPREPREMRAIKPFAAELSPLIEFPETVVPTVVPERTFLEKVFLLHEEFQKDYPRHKRMSRHLYDIYRLAKFGVADRAIADTGLYDSLVQHRSVFNAIRGIDYGGHSRERLAFLPPEHLLPLWEEDYRSMQDQFIYGDSPSFSELLKTLGTLQERLRNA